MADIGLGILRYQHEDNVQADEFVIQEFGPVSTVPADPTVAVHGILNV